MVSFTKIFLHPGPGETINVELPSTGIWGTPDVKFM
jgi:hypothetical protein